MSFRPDVAELAKKLGIRLPEDDDQGRLVRPIAEGDLTDIATEENSWQEEDL